MKNEPYAHTCPPLREYEGARTGFELWQPPERGLKKPKNGKPFQERARAAAVAPEPANLTRLTSQQRCGRGGILSLFIYGGFRRAGWLVRGVYRKLLCNQTKVKNR